MSPIDQFIDLVRTHHQILLVAGPIVLLFLYFFLRAIFLPKIKSNAPQPEVRPEPQQKPEAHQQPAPAKPELTDLEKPRKPELDTKASETSSELHKDELKKSEPGTVDERARRSVTLDMDRLEYETVEEAPESAAAEAAPEPEPEAAPTDDDMTPEPNDDHYLVDVFFATDRNRSVEKIEIFSGDRHPGEMLSFGSLRISVPLHHKVGKVEQPRWWHILLGVDRDPDRFFTIQDIEDFEERAFFEKVDAFQRARGAGEAFLFIHGYNNNFVDAAFRTGQIAFDMRFRGAGILYSWPSEGRLTSYYSDSENAKWTVPHLEDFLTKLAAVPSIKVLHLIAHSMGNQALAAALENLSLSGTVPAFNQIVLTAPDIDAGVFAQISRRIVAAAERVTLYASENDRALHVSRQFTSYPRLGDISDGVFIFDGIDTIDASNVDTDILGHGYFAKSDSILGDIDRLLSLRRPPGERAGLYPVQLGDGRTYWSFGP